MKLTISTLCFFASAVSAINYHGKHFTSEHFRNIENFGQALLKDNPNATIASVLSTDSMDSDEAIAFLNDGNVFNMTFSEFMDDIRSDTSVHERAPINYQCRSNAPRLSDTIRFQICSGLSSLAGGGVAVLAYYIDGLACNQRKNNPTACHAFYTFSGVSGGTLAVNEVNEYCPSLLAKIKAECGNDGGRAQDPDSGFQLNVRYEEGSQGDCRDVTGNCKVDNNS